MTKQQALNGLAAVNPGACNPRGLARGLVESIDIDKQFDFNRNTTSSATKLIMHQLWYLLSGKELLTLDEYCAAEKACKADANRG